MNIVANQELFFVFDDKGVRAMGAVVRFDISRISIECVSSSQSASLKLQRMASASDSPSFASSHGVSIDDVAVPIDSIRRPAQVYPPVARAGLS